MVASQRPRRQAPSKLTPPHQRSRAQVVRRARVNYGSIRPLAQVREPVVRTAPASPVDRARDARTPSGKGRAVPDPGPEANRRTPGPAGRSRRSRRTSLVPARSDPDHPFEGTAPLTRSGFNSWYSPLDHSGRSDVRDMLHRLVQRPLVQPYREDAERAGRVGVAVGARPDAVGRFVRWLARTATSPPSARRSRRRSSAAHGHGRSVSSLASRSHGRFL